jgi:hypothetical protein
VACTSWNEQRKNKEGKEIKQKKRKQVDTWMKINNKLNKEQRKNERNYSKEQTTIHFAVLKILLILERLHREGKMVRTFSSYGVKKCM